jgi:undecaprenyl-diphosphatase
MSQFRNTHYLKLTWYFIALCTLLRLAYVQMFPLAPDEANYWQWSRYLAWGYHDQAPLIAWAIRFATTLFGHSETAVRLPSIISMSVASIYIALIARRWFSDRMAWQTTLLGHTIMLFNIGGLLATADGLQAAAWAGGAYHAARSIEENRLMQWLSAGAWVGVGLLSKYTMVLFPLFVFLFALLSDKYRSTLATFRPYVALIFGLIIFAPVIGWNIANGWNSARHVAHIGGADQGFSIHWNYFGDFIGSQAALISPLVFIFVCLGWLRIIRQKYPKKHFIYFYLFCISFPMIAGFAILSLHTRVYGNWPGAGYLGAILLATAFFSPQDDSESENKKQNLWRWAMGISAITTIILLIQVIYPIVPISGKYDRTASEIRGWDELGHKVGEMLREGANPAHTFIFGLNYQVASELAFYVPDQPRTVSINRWHRPNVYDYWWEDRDLIGKDAIGVIENPKSEKRLAEVFEHVDSPEEISIYRFSIWDKAMNEATLVKKWYIYRCYGFKGGLRWIPKRVGDIRAR